MTYRLPAVFIIALVTFSAKANAAVTFDASAYGTCGTISGQTNCTSGGTVLTYPLTVGSGLNRALAVMVSVAQFTNVPTVSSVTYAGVSLNLVTSATWSSGINIYLYSLPPGTQPASGTNNVVVTLNWALNTGNGGGGTSGSVHSGAISAYNVDPATTFTSYNAVVSSTQTTSATITIGSSNANDLSFAAGCSGTTFNGTTFTSQWNCSNTNTPEVCTEANYCDATAGITAAGGTTTLSWAISKDSWALVGGAFKAARVKHRVTNY